MHTFASMVRTSSLHGACTLRGWTRFQAVSKLTVCRRVAGSRGCTLPFLALGTGRSSHDRSRSGIRTALIPKLLDSMHSEIRSSGPNACMRQWNWMVYTLVRTKQFLGTSCALRSDTVLFCWCAQDFSCPRCEAVAGDLCSATRGQRCAAKDFFNPVSHQCWTKGCREGILLTPVSRCPTHSACGNDVLHQFSYPSHQRMLRRILCGQCEEDTNTLPQIGTNIFQNTFHVSRP